MRTLIYILAVGLMITTIAFTQPNTLWTQTYGGSTLEYAYNVRETSDGGFIVTGCTDSFGAGGVDLYLIKIDSAGDTLWTKVYGGSADDEGFDVEQTTDGGYIVVGYTGSYGAGSMDIYLVKTDANGDTLWTRTYGGGGYEEGHSVQQTPDGGYIISGNTDSFGAGYADLILIKTDSSGNLIWSNTYGGISSDYGRSVKLTDDGGYITAGYTSSFGAGGNDFWLIRTDADGTTLWSNTFGGPGYEIGYCVQLTQDGNYVVAGVTDSYGAGGLDFYLVKVDTSGNELWSQTYGGSSIERGYSVYPTDDGGYIFTGYTNSYGAGDSDVYLIKTDRSGIEQWSQTYGGSSAEYGYCVEQTDDGGFIIGGYTISYGAGDWDVWLICLESEASTINKIVEFNPLSFKLYPPHPNPFNASTAINYQLLAASQLNLSVYDIMGREVAKLVDGYQNAGNHEIIFDAKDLVSGVYFVRLEVDGGQSIVQKVVLMK